MVLTVLYAALAQFGAAVPFELTRAIRYPSSKTNEDNIEFSAALMEALTVSRKPELSALPAQAQEMLQDQIDVSFRLYAEVFSEQLTRAAGTPLPGLRRTNKRGSRTAIIVTSENPTWGLELRILASGVKSVVTPPALQDAWNRVDKTGWQRFRNRSRRLARTTASQVLRDLSIEVIRACFSDFPRHTRYMPAARSGLMQSQKALAGSIVRESSWAGIREMRIPAVSGIVADFLGEMVEMGVRPLGQFPEHAARLEQEILHGSIEMKEDPSGHYLEPVYLSNDGEFPLSRTSSMVSELAPVVLYLRQLMQRGDLLMIEEPEAHLHPRAQVAFARTLARLANAGLAIATTTHSEFFLQQINNAVVAANVKGSGSEKIGLDRDTRLSAKNVAAYLFRPGDDGTQVVELSIDPREGIPEDSFSEVAEYLYAQTVALDKRLSDDPED
ncbi:AAA family ATPase [Micromonospora sp. NPDC000668]|uniref:AAA family ATPase n=1 Tax=Micromonospora sp. NPDC000668 TaxID=3364219 RepID=UPI0036A8B4FE